MQKNNLQYDYFKVSTVMNNYYQKKAEIGVLEAV